MGAKTSLILLAICLPFGVWVWWDLNREDEAPSSMGPLLDDPREELIHKLVIDRPVEAASTTEPKARTRIVFEKRGREWWITTPIVDVADGDEIQRLAEQPFTRWTSTYIEPQADPARFGFGPEATRVSIFGTAWREEIILGRLASYRQTQYVMVKGAKRVAVMDQDFGAGYMAALEGYRQSRPEVFKKEDVAGIEIKALVSSSSEKPQNEPGLHVLARFESNWVVKHREVEAVVPDGLVNRLLDELVALRIKRFLRIETSFELHGPPDGFMPRWQVNVGFADSNFEPISFVVAESPEPAKKVLLIGVPRRGVWGSIEGGGLVGLDALLDHIRSCK